MSPLKIVLDTNVLLVSLSSKSQYHWLFQELLNNKFNLYLTTEIIMEYEEVITLKYHPEVAKNVLRTLLKLPNVYKQPIYYHWHLIDADPDDNKFVDCAVSANTHYLVSHDKHSDVLRDITFPRVVVLKLNEFKQILNNYSR